MRKYGDFCQFNDSVPVSESSTPYQRGISGLRRGLGKSSLSVSDQGECWVASQAGTHPAGRAWEPRAAAPVLTWKPVPGWMHPRVPFLPMCPQILSPPGSPFWQ